MTTVMDQDTQISRKTMSVIWYGERGILNALVFALEMESIKIVDRTRSLLKAVQWADHKTPSWIESVEDVKIIVEVGLADFGNPDLIFVLVSRDGTRRALFVEAKVGPYINSALSNKNGMTRKSFNSSINGQLSLRYRFAHALARWDGKSEEIAEPTALFHAYQKPPGIGLGDKLKAPRHLLKRSVLDILHDAGLASLPMEQCYFVALTWDEKPFFEEDNDLLPLLLDEEVCPIWDKSRPSFGWLGYEGLRSAVHPGDSYDKAMRTMFNYSTPRSSVSMQGDYASWEKLQTTNRKQFGPSTLKLLQAIEDTARERFGTLPLKRHKGSSSITIEGKVRLSLALKKEGEEELLFLGISATEAPNDWCNNYELKPYRIGVNAQPFLVLLLPKESEAAIKIADSIFQEVQARHTSEN